MSTASLAETLPARLTELREMAGLTRKELAAAVGTSLSAIYEIEGGKRGISLLIATKLAEVLACTVNDLLEPTGTPCPFWVPGATGKKSRTKLPNP